MNNLVLHWPQLLYLALLFLGVGGGVARYGQLKKSDSYDIIDVLIAPALLLGLLYAGGFFTGGAP